MTKKPFKKIVRPEKEDGGCLQGFSRIFSSRQERKLLLDRKNASKRHVAGGHSRTKLGQLMEIDMEDNGNDEHTPEGVNVELPTVRTLMEEEMDEGLPLQKTPCEALEVNGFGHDTSTAESDSCENDQTAHRNSDSNSSSNTNSAQGADLEMVLASFLVEIFRYHSECKHADCKTKTGLCPALKSIIQRKLNDLNSSDSFLDEKHLDSSKAVQSKEFMDALEILSSNKEYFLKLLHDPNLHVLESIRILCNRNRGSEFESNKVVEQTKFAKEMGKQERSQEQPFNKALGKQHRHHFFWRKDKSNTRQTLEGADGSPAVSRIVVLKPNSARVGNSTGPTSQSSSCQSSHRLRPPDSSEIKAPHFMSEIKRKIKFFIDEKRREKNLTPKDGHRKFPFWLKDSTVVDEQVFREGLVRSLTGETLLDKCKSYRSLCVDESLLYEETRKHLTEVLNNGNGDQVVYSQAVEISGLSSRTVSVHEYDPRDRPGSDNELELSQKETKLYLQKFEEQDATEGLSPSKQNTETDTGEVSMGVEQMLGSKTKLDEVELSPEETKLYSLQKFEEEDAAEGLSPIKLNSQIDTCNVSVGVDEQILDSKTIKLVEIALSLEETKLYSLQKFEEEGAAEDLSPSKQNSESDTCDVSIGVDEQILNSKPKLDEIECQEGNCTDHKGMIDSIDVGDVVCIESSYNCNVCPETYNNGSHIFDERFNEGLVPDTREESKPTKESLPFSCCSFEDFSERTEQPSEATIEEATTLSSPSSPESSTEKPEKPSPVSVLDPFSDDIASPVCEATENIELPMGSSNVQIKEHAVSSLPRKFISDAGLVSEYIKSVLAVSGLSTINSLERWYLADQLLDPSLFNEVEDSLFQTDDSKLIFDCISEVLMEIQERYFRYAPWMSFLNRDVRPPPTGGNIVPEVSRGVAHRLHDEIPSTLEQLLKKDMDDGSWMVLRSDISCIVIEVWDGVLDDLLEEAVFDLWLED